MYKLIIVEDEQQIQRGLKKMIEDYIGGFHVVYAAENGRDALDWLKGNTADALLTDIRMKEMGGIELIKRLREQLPGLPVVVISGYGEFEYARESLRYGAVDYLLKPVDRVELTQVLEKVKARLEEQHAVPRTTPAASETERDGERKIIRQVKELIQNRLDQDISLQYLADQVHMNHRYLSVLFKNETGRNLSDYILECRITRAKSLLKETNLKVMDVSRLCGYGNEKYFMSVFKQTVGMTPSEFRDSI